MQGLILVGCLVLGLVVGVCAVALHQRWWGLLLGLAAAATTAVALPPGWWARVPFAVGAAAAIAYLAFPRAEGDYVIASDVPGYVLLGSTVALVVGAAVTLRPIRRDPAPEQQTRP